MKRLCRIRLVVSVLVRRKKPKPSKNTSMPKNFHRWVMQLIATMISTNLMNLEGKKELKIRRERKKNKLTQIVVQRKCLLIRGNSTVADWCPVELIYIFVLR